MTKEALIQEALYIESKGDIDVMSVKQQDSQRLAWLRRQKRASLEAWLNWLKGRQS